MSLLRRHRCPLARLAFFAFLCGSMLPFYEAHPLGVADDAACLVASGDNGASRVGGPSAEDAGEHCLVCHLKRGLSGASPSAVVSLSTPFESSSCSWFDQRDPLSAANAAPSSRGPPAPLSI